MTRKDTLLGRAARHSASVRWDALSPEEHRAIKRLVADSVATAIAAAGSDDFARLEEAVATEAACQERAAVQVLGRGRHDLENAILLNCALVRGLDLMDVFWGRDVCHPSENIPVALSVGQAMRASGREVLEAAVAAYDLQVGLCRLVSFAGAGLHHVSSGGVVLPLLISRLMRVDETVAARAATLTVYRTVTLGVLSRGELSSAKAFSYGLTAVDSLRAVRLAAAGLTGPALALEWLTERVMGTPITGEDLDDALGGSVTEVAIKRYPAQFALQGPVEAAATLGRELAVQGLDASRVEDVVVRVPRWTIERTTDASKYEPESRETADHSLPVCVAMALLEGDITPASMLGNRWAQPEVLDLARRVRPVRDAKLEAANPGGGPGAVEVHLEDGTRRTHSVRYPIGDPRRPMSDEQLHAKFTALTRSHLGVTAVEDLWSRLLRLEDEEGMNDVMSRAGGQRVDDLGMDRELQQGGVPR